MGESGWGHLGVWRGMGGDLRGCCVDGVYTLFMLCHSLQLIDYERVCLRFIHCIRLGSYCEKLMWRRLFYEESTCLYLACMQSACSNEYAVSCSCVL